MQSQPVQSTSMQPDEEAQVRALHSQILERWNERDAQALSALYAEDGHLVGFDGSAIDGKAEIESTINGIFAHHQTGVYVGKIREVIFLAANAAVVRAVVGMAAPGESDLDPALNAIQTLVAAKRDGAWRVTLFQNTPAQFHGRPDLAEQLTDEMRKLR
jgi:uncharacterized protein (TIGR02246 family)